MTTEVSLVPNDTVAALRDLYVREMSCQIVRYSWFGRKFSDSYLLRLDGRVVGYGLVGGVRDEPRDAIMEFYVLPAFRGAALELFRRLAEASKAKKVEGQSNDALLTLMLYDCCESIASEAVIFHDGFTSHLANPGVTFRRTAEGEKEIVFAHNVEPIGDWVIDLGGEVVATGGVLFHYNVPYGDLYMETAEPFRRRGYASFLLQELKRVCYEMGRIPAARCNVKNAASRATLQKAGMIPCGRLLTGTLGASVGA